MSKVQQKNKPFVPVNEPLLDGNEKKYLLECIKTGWISSEGPFIKKFEERFAETVRRRYGVAVSSGSAALEVAVKTLNLGKGDEVILPSFTIISCAAAIVRAGAVPVLVDVDPISWTMNLDQVEAKITPKTRALMVVHLYGLPCDMRRVAILAKKFNLKVIEDAAQMHGQTCNESPCGSFGDISIFSFYPNKHITTGEGGMLVTNDAGLAEKCQSLRNLCFQPARRFVHEELGWNFRITNLQAALGLAQLERLNKFVQKKREMGRYYTQLLSDSKNIQLPLQKNACAENIYWVYGIVLRDQVPFDASGAMEKLASLGIGTRPFFWGMHEQPVFRRAGLFKNESYPVTERLARRGFYLPSGLALTREQIKRSAGALKAILL